jgi:hypothetical protein
MKPSYILKLKGRCLNCGAVVEERRTDIFCESSHEQAQEYFAIARESNQHRNSMSNHECSDNESGYVESISLKLDISTR